jgi:hypothetical protein
MELLPRYSALSRLTPLKLFPLSARLSVPGWRCWRLGSDKIRIPSHRDSEVLKLKLRSEKLPLLSRKPERQNLGKSALSRNN